MNRTEQAIAESEKPKGTDWERDGVAMSASGHIMLKLDSLTVMEVTKEYLVECLQIRRKHEEEISDLKLRINEREPAPFLRTILTDLDECGNEAGKLRGEGAAGKIMWGQAQAYRDSVARIKACLPKTWRYD